LPVIVEPLLASYDWRAVRVQLEAAGLEEGSARVHVASVLESLAEINKFLNHVLCAFVLEDLKILLQRYHQQQLRKFLHVFQNDS
jgi:hypothetical protein